MGLLCDYEILANLRLKLYSRQFSAWDERMKKYHGAGIVPFNSHAARWNSCQDLIEEQRIIDKKAVRERIKNRVLSSVHQALENKIDEIFSYCESKDFNIKGKLNLKPSKYKLSHQSVEQEFVTTFECVEFRQTCKRCLTMFGYYKTADGLLDKFSVHDDSRQNHLLL